ncbi:uncharacterized protein LOC106873154 [Octopus bimaculoides]|uniref:uncharacterized protein LOC106873154 n=1 Tax=Octopus bimaculoides TaxID=37653 RepID=UPI00071C7258|nr:uncharacterized protein LOC106873154 [Octopus bimaculoides]|eukprot:XP_014775867.1 PREDICTED: uncharacterized protein LOC106873154 [Octopus bimaculoides]
MRVLSSKWKQACFLDDLRSHDMHVMVATETNLDSLQTFSPLLNGYEKIMSPSQTRDHGGVLVLARKGLALQTSTVYVNPEGGLVVLDVTYSGKAFRLIRIYAPCARGLQTDFYRRLENFLVTSKTLVVLGDYNAIVDAHIDSVGSSDRKVNSRFVDLLKKFQLADGYRPDHPNVPEWTWVNGDSRFKSYLDRIVIRARDKASFSCPHLVQVSYTDHRMVKCKLNIVRLREYLVTGS